MQDEQNYGYVDIGVVTTNPPSEVVPTPDSPGDVVQRLAVVEEAVQRIYHALGSLMSLAKITEASLSTINKVVGIENRVLQASVLIDKFKEDMIDGVLSDKESQLVAESLAYSEAQVDSVAETPTHILVSVTALRELLTDLETVLDKLTPEQVDEFDTISAVLAYFNINHGIEIEIETPDDGDESEG